MEGDIDVIPLIHGESHRCGNISSHELLSAEYRKCDVHDEIFVLICEWRNPFYCRYIAETVDRSLEFSSEYGVVKIEGFFCLVREVQICGSGGHKKKSEKIKSEEYFLLPRLF